jgi:nucleotide-binding universal stress UspA family protein
VGFDGGSESRVALSLAGSLARAADATLAVRAVIDDRLPLVGWAKSRELLKDMWDELLEPELQAQREDAIAAGRATGAEAEIEAIPGSPSQLLLELSATIDLLVIGSRRWGAAARVLLGTTGEALMHEASCPVLVAPRPPA